MKSLKDLTVEELRRAVSIKSQIESLEDELDRTLGGWVGSGLAANAFKRKPGRPGRPKKEVIVKKRRKMSAAGRARIAAAARARWAKAKAAGKNRL